MIAAGAVTSLSIGCAESTHTPFQSYTGPSSPTNTSQPTNPTPTAQPTNPTSTAQPITPTAQPQPLFAAIEDVSPSGSYALGIDLRTPTFGKYVAIDTVSGTSVVLDAVLGVDHHSSVGERTALFSREIPLAQPVNYYTSQQDLTLRDLATGATLYASQTPDKSEWLEGTIGGKYIVQERSVNGQFRHALEIDEQGNSKKIIAQSLASDVFKNEWGWFIQEFTNSYPKFHTLDAQGNPSLLLDMNQTSPQGGGWIDYASRPDFVIYNTNMGEEVFHPINATNTSQVVVSPNMNSSWQSFSIAGVAPHAYRALLREWIQTGPEFFDVDLDALVQVVLFQLPSQFQANTALVGEKTTLLKSYSTPEIYGYDRTNGVWNVLDPLTPTPTAILSETDFWSAEGKAIITAEWLDTVTGNSFQSAYMFDGQNVTQSGQFYEYINKPAVTGKVSAFVGRSFDPITGTRNDNLVIVDMLTGNSQTLPALPEQSIDDVVINKRGDVAFSQYNNNWLTGQAPQKNNKLYLVRVGSQPQLIDESYLGINDLIYSPDGNALFYNAHSGPIVNIKFDLTTNTSTVISNR